MNDPLYVVARSVLLDALEALGEQRRAVVLVGAQAIYIHTGEGELAVAAFTTDGDLVIDPARLEPEPELGAALQRAGFVPGGQVGTWVMHRFAGQTPVDVPVDLLVPDAVGGAGRRAARLVGHQRHVARKARGLEGALIEHEVHSIGALDGEDVRRFEILVAGPSSLLVAKLHQLVDRSEDLGGKRLKDKDALDVLRLLRAVRMETLAHGLRRLRSERVSGDVTTEAIRHLEALFASSRALGSQMVVRATEGLEDPTTIARSCEALARELLAEIEQ